MQLGSGTDPVEGGCLAAVLLEWLLTRARLTFCTSHHADLKELSVRHCNCYTRIVLKALISTASCEKGDFSEKALTK